jgi:predicted transcriptional regulator
MAELLQKGFVVRHGKSYSLTDKGFEFLAQYRTIKEFIDNFGL